MKIRTPYYNWEAYNFGSISLCMIMRNDAKTLARCLNSIRRLVNDIIICDTGSTDGSKKIAKKFGCTVLTEAWHDDFASPRNVSIRAATSDWILVMDPDEIFLAKDHNALKWLTRTQFYDAYWLTTYNYGPKSYRMEYKVVGVNNDPLRKFPGYVPSTKTRFFRNGLGIQFEGCYHELADWYIRRNKLKQGSSPIPIHHWIGEISQTSRQEKKAFYLKMGEKKVREWPKNPQARWELATSEMAAGYRERACRTLKMAFKLGFNRKDMYYNISKCQTALGNKDLANLAFEKGCCMQYPGLTHIDPDKKPMAKLLERL